MDDDRSTSCRGRKRLGVMPPIECEHCYSGEVSAQVPDDIEPGGFVEVYVPCEWCDGTGYQQ